jgi:hypothetical protein
MAIIKLNREPIGFEARGRLRELNKGLDADYRRLDATYRAMGGMADFVRKTGKGPQRIFDRWNDAFRGAGAHLEEMRLDGKEPVALWSILRPRDAVLANPDHPRDEQDCVCVNYVALGALPVFHGQPSWLRRGFVDA